MQQEKIIYPWETGLLFEDGKFVKELSAGRYKLTSFFKKIEIFTVINNEQRSNISEIEVVSQDGLSYRMSCSVLFRVTKAYEAYEKRNLYELNNCVREAVTNIASPIKIMDIYLKKPELDALIFVSLKNIPSYLEIFRVQITTINLPPEIRRSLNEIERAKWESLAALERARGEQASMRSLANTARMLKGNPELMNLRLLQTLSNTKNKPTIVLGQGALMSLRTGEDEGAFS